MTDQTPFKGNDRELAAYKAGQVDERLDNFDEHFKVVNGSIAKSAEALSELVKIVVEVKAQIKIAAYVAGAFLTAWISAIAYLILHVR